jgi:penicillin-binding protein 1C
MMYLAFRHGKRRRRRVVIAAAFIFFIFCLPDVLFDPPTCTVLVDTKNQLLAASIAEDGQYRFPHNPHVPSRFEQALITFEDRHFYNHLGVHVPSIVRAAIQNFEQGKIVSGGSTLTMQVVRLSRKNPDRNYLEKFFELFRALRLETKYSKSEILALYASHAPMGGNVVGLDAAAWRYFGTSAEELTWAQSTTLAVLPNAPSLIYPGKNQQKLLEKRNRVLKELHNQGAIDLTTYNLSIAESLPSSPNPLPQLTPHLLNYVLASGQKGQFVKTTIHADRQHSINKIVSRYAENLEHNQIFNCAVLVMEVETGEVISYVGNAPGKGHGRQVDVIQAPRSSGSILKPFLYASMLQDGEILPNTLIADIPTRIGSYAPTNFNETFSGAVSAKVALSRSLNVPAVRMLKAHGIDKFHHRLKMLGFAHINQPASHYGLTLILGGAEVTLWELAGAYGSMARSLNHYTSLNGSYDEQDWQTPHFQSKQEGSSLKRPFEASVIHHCFDALTQVHRPTEESGWEFFNSSRRIAWKTGTSFGFRDAWAVGVSPKYVVAVWVGNADGVGRPGITGVKAAAPLLFEIVDDLQFETWFDAPYDEMQRIAVCAQSGHRAQRFCETSDTTWVTKRGLKTAPCPYHQRIHTDPSHNLRVHQDCSDGSQIIANNWFVLPPAQAWYYSEQHPDYKALPKWKEGCQGAETENPIDLIYPSRYTTVSVPTSINGVKQKVILEAAHNRPEAQMFWHLGSMFLGTTQTFHQMEVDVAEGTYQLVLTDEQGNTVQQSIVFVDIHSSP